MKRLMPGETRIMRRGLMACRQLEVQAYCKDSETPYINLIFGAHGDIITLTDSEAEELRNRLRMALDVLPSSK